MTDQELFALVDDVRELRSRVRLLEAQVKSLQMAAPRGIPKAEEMPSLAPLPLFNVDDDVTVNMAGDVGRGVWRVTGFPDEGGVALSRGNEDIILAPHFLRAVNWPAAPSSGEAERIASWVEQYGEKSGLADIIESVRRQTIEECAAWIEGRAHPDWASRDVGPALRAQIPATPFTRDAKEKKT